MLDFLKDIIWWLWKKIALVFLPIVGWLIWLCENFPETMKKIFTYLIDCLKWYITDFYLWLFEKLTVLITEFFADNEFIVGVAEFSNDTFTAMNVFIPLNEACVCVSLIVSTMVSVFIIRIILKAIPTVW